MASREFIPPQPRKIIPMHEILESADFITFPSENSSPAEKSLPTETDPLQEAINCVGSALEKFEGIASQLFGPQE